MSQSLTQIYLHIVYSTKLRQPFLKSKVLRDQTFAYLAGVCQKYESPALIIGGVEDHVHLLVRFSKNLKLADFIRELKRDSSKWVKEQPTGMTDFHWQSGYGAFSISPGHVSALMKPNPRCAARPWAVLWNRFAVRETRQRQIKIQNT